MTYFVDTNVFVYVRDDTHPAKRDRSAEWLSWLWSTGNGATSTQVLNELYVTLTRKVSRARGPDLARQDVTALTAWDPLATDAALVREAWAVTDRFGLSHWDALIVAAAHRLDVRHVLTEDLNAGQNYDGVIVVNPFMTPPPH